MAFPMFATRLPPEAVLVATLCSEDQTESVQRSYEQVGKVEMKPLVSLVDGTVSRRA